MLGDVLSHKKVEPVSLTSVAINNVSASQCSNSTNVAQMDVMPKEEVALSKIDSRNYLILSSN